MDTPLLLFLDTGQVTELWSEIPEGGQLSHLSWLFCLTKNLHDQQLFTVEQLSSPDYLKVKAHSMKTCSVLLFFFFISLVLWSLLQKQVFLSHHTTDVRQVPFRLISLHIRCSKVVHFKWNLMVGHWSCKSLTVYLGCWFFCKSA